MIKLSDYKTQNALPAEMKTPERTALSYAFDEQKKKYISRMRRAYIWADLESVDDNHLDFLAVENRVLFYNTEIEPDVKRNLIRNSIYWHMKLGTKQVMEEMIDTVFGDGKVLEWFEYGGEPFHFKVILNAENGKAAINLADVRQKINAYKRLSARLDDIELEYYFHVWVSYKNAVLVHINFWPRYLLTLLKLSGDWKLDGSHRLSGYNTGEYVDYYPVRTTAHILAHVPVSWDEGASARSSAKLGTDYCMDVSARSAACIRVPGRSYDNVQAAAYTSVQAAPTVSDGNVQIINRLTGKWKLDGSRKLNAGVYPLL